MSTKKLFPKNLNQKTGEKEVFFLTKYNFRSKIYNRKKWPSATFINTQRKAIKWTTNLTLGKALKRENG